MRTVGELEADIDTVLQLHAAAVDRGNALEDKLEAAYLALRAAQHMLRYDETRSRMFEIATPAERAADEEAERQSAEVAQPHLFLERLTECGFIEWQKQVGAIPTSGKD